MVVEESKAQGVTAFDVVIPNVCKFVLQHSARKRTRTKSDAQTDGKGSGEWRKISTSIPAHVRTGIKYKTVHKFEKDAVSFAA